MNDVATAGRPAPQPPDELLTASDLPAIIVRQEREKQALLDKITKLTSRAEAAEQERNALGLSLLNVADALANRAETVAGLDAVHKDHAARDEAGRLRTLAGQARKAAGQAQYEGRETGILAAALGVGARLLVERLDRFEQHERAALLEAPEILGLLLTDLRTIAVNQERALRRAEQAGLGEDAPPARQQAEGPQVVRCNRGAKHGVCGEPAAFTLLGPDIEDDLCAQHAAEINPIPPGLQLVPIEEVRW